MRLFYHAKNGFETGFLKIMIILLILLLAIYFMVTKVLDLSEFGINFSENDTEQVELTNLVSYSSLYNEQHVCTEGYHVNSSQYNVLKTEVDTDIYLNSIWLAYAEGTQNRFASIVPRGKVAKVSLCGIFEAGRGKQFGDPSIWRKQIIIDEYELLENPELGNF